MRTTVATRLLTGLLAGLLAGGFAACSSTSPSLPYRPAVQPPGATVSAAYTIVSDRLRVEIAGGGRRVERAQIVKPDGTVLEAQTIEYTPAAGGGGSPFSIGFGLGGVSSTGGGGAVGSGVGVGVAPGVGVGITPVVCTAHRYSRRVRPLSWTRLAYVRPTYRTCHGSYV